MVVALLLGACSAAASSGPVHGAPSVSTIEVAPGERATYGLLLTADRPHRVELERASLLPLKGFRSPRLTHLAVVLGPGAQVTASRGWPLPASVLGGRVARPFHGATVTVGPYAGYRTMVLYTVTLAAGQTVAGVEGLRITYSSGGAQYSTTVDDAGIACVATGSISVTAAEQRCDEAGILAHAEIARQLGIGG